MSAASSTYLCAVALCYTFFFFQAEDGIRDHCVTGVQTCALPISPFPFACGRSGPVQKAVHGQRRSHGEIGRASCRERVMISGADAPVTDERDVRLRLEGALG